MENDYVKVATIGKSFGSDGTVRIKMFPEFLDTAKKEDFIFLDWDNYFVPFRILKWKKSDQYIIFDDIVNQHQADKLQGKSCFLPKALVSHLIQEEELPFLGFTIFNDSKSIGKVIHIEEMTDQFLATVIFNENEVFIPIHESLIIDINPDKKELYMELPEGLLNL